MNFSKKNHEHIKAIKIAVSKKQLKTIALLFLAFTFINCTKSDDTITPVVEDQLPPITQTGENTFGCLINGNVFIPKDKTGYTPPGGGRPRGINIYTGSYSSTSDYFVIRARNFNNIYLYIYREKDVPEESITYNFSNSPGVGYSLEAPNYPHTFCLINGIKYLTFLNSGEITYSKVNFNLGLYAGTFSLKLKNENNPNDILEITQGRFDINLATLNN